MLELPPLPQDTLTLFIKEAVHRLQDRQYHISVGHQVEVTSSRLVLNTTDLAPANVEELFHLLRLPGHYEFICYSTREHLHLAVELFRLKPLVKLNFFVPLEEFKDETRTLIERMSSHADWLLHKVYAYSSILKQHAGLGYLAVNAFFYALA